MPGKPTTRAKKTKVGLEEHKTNLLSAIAADVHESRYEGQVKHQILIFSRKR